MNRSNFIYNIEKILLCYFHTSTSKINILSSICIILYNECQLYLYRNCPSAWKKGRRDEQDRLKNAMQWEVMLSIHLTCLSFTIAWLSSHPLFLHKTCQQVLSSLSRLQRWRMLGLKDGDAIRLYLKKRLILSSYHVRFVGKKRENTHNEAPWATACKVTLYCFNILSKVTDRSESAKKGRIGIREHLF